MMAIVHYKCMVPLIGITILVVKVGFWCFGSSKKNLSDILHDLVLEREKTFIEMCSII